MDLYFKDVNATGSWNDPDHWFEDAAATIPYNAVPWVTDDATKAYDLHRSTDSVANGEIVYIDADIGNGFTITGTCSIRYEAGATNLGFLQNNYNIYSGTFTGDYFYNSGSIYDGSFVLDYFSNYGSISGGSFVVNNFSNGNYIYAGKFDGTGYGSGTPSAYIYGGIFNTTTGLFPDGFSMYGTVIDFTTLSDYLFIGGGNWAGSTWYEDYECTIAWAGDTPWTTSATSSKNVARGLLAESTNVIIDTTIGDPANAFEITGTCHIYYNLNYYLENTGYIYSGNFPTDSFLNYGSIYGGSFSGYSFVNGSYISGGTFTGDYFSNNSAIEGGTFTCPTFYNSGSSGYINYIDYNGNQFNNDGGYIYAGTFTATYCNNDAGGNIYGGRFNVDYFYNNYSTYIYGGYFAGSEMNNYSYIYNGVFVSDFFNDSGGYIYSGIFAPSSSNFGYAIYGGSFLESGTMDVDFVEYINGSYESFVFSITGKTTNPYPVNNGIGLVTMRIRGQDVLGTGLL